MKWIVRFLVAACVVFALLGLSKISVIPILVYSDEIEPKVFNCQMEFLKAHRYSVISMEELAEGISSGRSIPKKSIVITFDGGLKELYKSHYHVLKSMGYPSLVYIHANALGYPGFLKASQVRTLLRNGVDIGSKGLSGQSFEQKRQAEARTEIFGSKRSLENMLSYPVNHFCYPSGYHEENITDLVEEAGYLSAVTLDTQLSSKLNRYVLPRVVIGKNDSSLLSFWFKISGFYGVGNFFRNLL